VAEDGDDGGLRDPPRAQRRAAGERVIVFGSHPGRIIGEFQVELPRPRSETDRGLIALSEAITERFGASVRREREEERRGGG
jgi:hypothetical protein